jgi:outer membrane protein OmpA-like peptidoglycan-associated protein
MIRTLLVAVVVMSLIGCATRERIVVLPESGGGATSLAVTQNGKQLLLDQPYAATQLSLADPWRYSATPEEVRSTFGAALAVQPARAARYTLYFVEGSDELTEESKDLLTNMFADVGTRPTPDIVVVGHTDAVGNDSYNDALALKRAEAVKAMLVGRGIAQDDIVAIGRGKRELLVPTPDGVAEPRNRRVEIVVR